MTKLPPNILSNAKIGKHSDGAGLSLIVKGHDSRGRVKGSWLFRYTFHKQRYEIGIGSAASLTLAQARNECQRWRDLMADPRTPINPIDEKRRLSQVAARERNSATLNEITNIAFEAIKGTLKGDGKAGRWLSPLKLHILPVIGGMRIVEIHQQDIERALRPIWRTKNPTAKKAIERLNIVMKHGAAMGLDVNLNAVLNAKQILGHSGHIVKNHPSLPWQDLPQLYQSLDPENTVQRALMLYILVGGGMRLGPLRAATFDQFTETEWNISGEILKGRKGKERDLRFPITTEMQRLIDISVDAAVDRLLFPSPNSKTGKAMPISDQAIENVMRNREQEWEWPDAYRPHGLRASFATWGGDNFPNEFAAIETTLAHTIGGAVERAYNRSDYFEQRKALMQKWQNHVLGINQAAGRVVNIRGQI